MLIKIGLRGLLREWLSDLCSLSPQSTKSQARLCQSVNCPFYLTNSENFAIIKLTNTKQMPAKKHSYEIGELSSALDKVVVQGSKVFINFSGNEKTYEYKWKPASSQLISVLDKFVKNPESVSLGRFYNDSLKSGDLTQITQVQ